jgi:hypothetical protein
MKWLGLVRAPVAARPGFFAQMLLIDFACPCSKFTQVFYLDGRPCDPCPIFFMLLPDTITIGKFTIDSKIYYRNRIGKQHKNISK